MIRLAKRVAAVVALAAICGVAVACPMCTESLNAGTLDGGKTGADLARGFYISLLVMVSTPFVVLGTFATCYVWAMKKAASGHLAGTTIKSA